MTDISIQEVANTMRALKAHYRFAEKGEEVALALLAAEGRAAELKKENELAEEKLIKTEAAIEDKNNEAIKIINDAKDQADQILSVAQKTRDEENKKAEQNASAAQNRLNKILKEIDEKTKVIVDLDKKNSDLLAEIQKNQDELEQFRQKILG